MLSGLCIFGQAVRWHGNRCRHFTVANVTADARVSFDARVLPRHLAREPARAGGGAMKLAAGGYYKLLRANGEPLPVRQPGPPPDGEAGGEAGGKACKRCGTVHLRGSFCERQARALLLLGPNTTLEPH